jgi:hypothetical protein
LLKQQLVGRDQCRVAGLEGTDQGFHQRQVAADNFDGFALGRLPERLQKRPVHGMFLDAVNDGIGVEIYHPGSGYD